MDRALDWIVVVLALLAPILVATEGATQLSILILCCLLGFFLVRRLLLAYLRRSNVQHWRLHATKVNDSLYELYKPKGLPTLQVLFFHGLPFGESSEAHLSTWISGDGSCIWPKVWLAEKFPDAHILVVSYIEGLKKGSAESFDMQIIRENLTSDLIQGNIGQVANCPVVLVGHSFGGLVIKDLCLEAYNTLISPRDKAKVEKFLENLRGIFYYSTPHHGSADIGRARKVLSRPLFEYLTVLSTKAVRLNYNFNRLHNSYRKWQIGGLGEQLPVKMGLFRGIVIVAEASARDGESFNVDSSADHFSISRPENTISRRFTGLTTLLHAICHNVKDEKATAQKQAVQQNLQDLPKQMINMDGLLEEVKSQLKKHTTLGFVGMGGLGKTTLAKAVFNELSPKFAYSCFVPDVKLIKGTVEEAKQAVCKHVHRFGRKVGDNDDLSDLIGKGLLLVLDDVSNDRDITILLHLANNSSPQSRFIVTSRDRMLLRSLDGIYEVPFLDSKDAEKLFLSHAFPKKAVVAPAVQRDVVSIVEKCGGLPLTLEVIGSYLKLNKDGKFWKQTLRALEKAEAIQDLDKRLWATLRVSYDGLGEVEKQMFLDATTFFNYTRSDDWQSSLTLRDAKAAWRETHGTECESLLWQTLVDRSLVYHVEENERIRVHDQLLSLGQKIASESARNGQCRVWEEKMASTLLQDDSEENKDIHALRLSSESTTKKIHISGHTLSKLKKLQYLDVDAPLLIDGVEEGTSFPSNLVLLRCVGDLDTFDLALQHRLVVLHLSDVGVLPSSIGQLSALRFIFIGGIMESVPNEFGNLSRLEHLELWYCYNLASLPESFGKLSQLQYLKFTLCESLRFLPETFGELSNLKELEFTGHEFVDYLGLRSLPQSFGDLSALNRLVVSWCPKLVALPSSFGNLSALDHLEVHHCDGLSALPSSFGNLSALNRLVVSRCPKLVALPSSFGNLSALDHLELHHCDGLCALPNSFGNLSALKYLRIEYCSQLHTLPDSFGNLLALEELKLSDCCVKALPNSFGNLSALDHLELHCCDELCALPNSFGNLSALKHLDIEDCSQLHTLPDSLGSLLALEELKLSGCRFEAPVNSVGKLSGLRHLELRDCENFLSMFSFSELTQLHYLEISGNCRLVQMEKLPESLAELTALSHLVLERISIRSIPDFVESMLSLHILELSALPYIKELPAWLGETGAAPLALSRKMFQAQDGRFHLTSEEFGKIEPSELIAKVHENAMVKFEESDYAGALADLCLPNLGVVEPKWERFLLVERGIARRFTGDLKGALEDLTAAVKVVQSGLDDGQDDLYECYKHRGYVNLLLGDLDGARMDGVIASKLLPNYRSDAFGVSSPRLGEKSVVYMDFRLIGRREIHRRELPVWRVHSEVMEKVTTSDFRVALAIWCAFHASVSSGFHGQVYFLQERGILKRMAGDLPGALEDLTAALEIWDDDYECLKHRGYVNFLLGDMDGARKDAERCLAMGVKEPGQSCLGAFPVAFLEFEL